MGIDDLKNFNEFLEGPGINVTKISKLSYRIDMTDEVFDHFMILTVASKQLQISNVQDLIAYILCSCEQNWFKCIQEPELTNNSQDKPCQDS